MKKLFIIFSIIVSILVAISFFINSTYFFNRYIATTIKDYGFNYKHVDGALLSGFKIDKLTYKNRQLAFNAELKFNPIKILEKKISVTKLRLINVNKDTLDTITRDFKPKDDSSSSTNIDFNFEIKDILLTIKPFKIEKENIEKNILYVDYIEYINNKFNIGKVNYIAQTSLGNIEFIGKYEHRVLNIDNLELKRFNLKQFLPILKTIQDGDTNSTAIDNNSSNPLIPKEINIKYAKLTLSPFKMKELSAKDLKVEIKNAKFNVDTLKLKQAEVNFKYRSNLARVASDMYLNNNELNISKIDINILQASKLQDIYKKYIDTNNTKSTKSTTPTIVNIKSVYLKDFNLHLKDYILKKEKIKSAYIIINNAFLDIKNKKLELSYYKSKIHTDTTFVDIDGSLGKKIVINNAIVKSSSIDKVITLFNKKSKNSNETTAYKFNIPTKYLIKNIKINGAKLSFNPFVIDKASIIANNISGDINKSIIDGGNLKVSVLSNWGTANLSGKIKNNNYYAKGKYKVDKKLLTKYNIPLIAKNIKPLKVDGKFGFKNLDINIKLSGKDILKSVKNIDILSSKNRLIYNYDTGNLNWSMNADVNSEYTGFAKLENRLLYTNKLKYSGKLIPKNGLSFTKKLGNLFNNLSLTYIGNSKKIDLAFKTEQLKGILKSNKYTGGILTIKNTKEIKISQLVPLYKGYKNAVIRKLKIEAPIKFTKILPLKGTLKATSNMLNIKGIWSYNKSFSTNFTATIDKKSLIAKKFPNLNLLYISPLNIELESKNNNINSKLKSKLLIGNLAYNLNNSNLSVQLNTNYIKLNAKGKVNNVNFTINTKSIKKALKNISKLYKIKKVANIDGNVIFKGNISKAGGIKLSAKSFKIIYQNKKKSTKLENILINIIYSKNNININKYHFKTAGYNFYANKTSVLTINKNILNINHLWLNDSLLVTGDYNLVSKIGRLKLKANNLKIDKPEAKVTLAINSNIKLNKDQIAVNGQVIIIDGVIRKNLSNKSIAQNDDIIILQRKASKENTDFAKNIKLDLKIRTQNGIVYSQNGSYFKLKPKLLIIKNYRELPSYKGFINIDKDGYYILNGKKLRLKKGIITFKSKTTTPNINIVMVYHGKEYDITINLSGTPSRPVLYFTSNPPLTKDQILAYLLFDDSTAAGAHSQEAMLSLIGGTIAKSFLGSIGIKIDHMSIKENGFSIGKSISKNITIYYKQDGQKSSIKTRLDITKSVHTDIEVGKESQSADIIFSKEY